MAFLRAISLLPEKKALFFFYPAEVVVQRCSVKKVFLEISQNSQENTWARVSFYKVAGLRLLLNSFFLNC